VLDNPKVHVVIGDAREVLLTTPRRYDLIFSEPSNPYRAGIASLFTREFYQAARERLEPGGVFVQWLQAYEIDSQSVLTVYATLASTFASVETWRSRYADLMLVSRDAEGPLDADSLRARIASPPFREALLATWRARSLEDVLARHVARPALAAAVAASMGEEHVNSDDVNLLEFSIARALGRPHDFSADRLLLAAHQRGEARPTFAGDGAKRIDWPAVYDAMQAMRLVTEGAPVAPPMVEASDDMDHRLRALMAWHDERPAAVLREWEQQPKAPHNPIEILMMADAYATVGNRAKAEPLIAELRTLVPVEADGVEVRLRLASGDPRGAVDALERSLIAYRTEPWANHLFMRRVMLMALDIASADRSLYPRLEAALREEMALSSLRQLRLDLYLDLTSGFGAPEDCVRAIAQYGRWFPWREPLLRQRVRCYENAQRAELASARAELDRFLADAGVDFGAAVRPDRPLPNVKP
jgi:spermidine synthase